MHNRVEDELAARLELGRRRPTAVPIEDFDLLVVPNPDDGGGVRASNTCEEKQDEGERRAPRRSTRSG